MGSEIKILMFTNMLCLMGYTLMTPLYPPLALDLGVSESIIGFVFSLYSLANVVSIPSLPFIFSKIKKKFLIKLSITLDAVCCLVFGLLPLISNKQIFIVVSGLARFHQGLSNAITSTIIYSMAVHFSVQGRIKKNIGLLELSASTGQAIGPLLGTFLTHFLGFGTPFFCLAALKIGLLFLIIFKLDIVESKCQKSNFFGALFFWDILVGFIVLIVDLASVNFYFPVLGNYLNKKFKISEEICNIFFVIQTVSYFLFINLIEKIHGLFGNKMTMSFGLLFNIFSVLLLPPVGIFPSSLITVGVGLSFMGMSEALGTIPSVENFVNILRGETLNIEEETANDLSSALYNFGVNLGDASGPLIGGFITEKKGFETACFYMSVANFSWFFVFIISSLKTIKEEIKNIGAEGDNLKRKTRLNGFGRESTVEMGYKNSLSMKREMILDNDTSSMEKRITYNCNIGNIYNKLLNEDENEKVINKDNLLINKE